MRMIPTVVLPAVFGAFLWIGGLPTFQRPARAEDFRVENATYLDDQREPWCESTTIFHNGVVYDCFKGGSETVVLDNAAGRFILLNLTHRTRAELLTAFVVAFTDRLQQVLAKQADPFTKFLVAPKFQERFDESTHELALSSAGG